MFWTWLQMVRTVASSLRFPHHFTTRSWGRQHSDSHNVHRQKTNQLPTHDGHHWYHYGHTDGLLLLLCMWISTSVASVLVPVLFHHVNINSLAQRDFEEHHFSCSFHSNTRFLLTFLFFLPSRLSSRLMWLNSRTSFPRGPLTVTVRPFSLTSTATSTRGAALETRSVSGDLDMQITRQPPLVPYHCRGGRQSDCWEWSSFCQWDAVSLEPWR